MEVRKRIHSADGKRMVIYKRPDGLFGYAERDALSDEDQRSPDGPCGITPDPERALYTAIGTVPWLSNELTGDNRYRLKPIDHRKPAPVVYDNTNVCCWSYIDERHRIHNLGLRDTAGVMICGQANAWLVYYCDDEWRQFCSDFCTSLRAAISQAKRSFSRINTTWEKRPAAARCNSE